MKKRMICILLLVLLCQLAVPALATQEQLKAADVTVQPEELIYVTLELAEPVLADTMGVYFTFDTTLLAMEEAQCAWNARGVIQDFDAEKYAGVWTDSEATAFQGQLCTAAFRVIAEKKQLETVISCRLILKNGADVAAELYTDVRVSVVCEHTYEAWQENGTQEHSKCCLRCGDVQTQAHQWDGGVEQEAPNQPGVQITVYTCQICQAARTEGQPEETVPATTQPKTDAPQQTAAPTQPGAQQPDPQNSPSQYWIAAVLAVAALLVPAFWAWKKKQK